MAATAKGPLWKPSNRSNGIEFLSNWKRLQHEDPATYALIKQENGFITQDSEHEYKVGLSQYGLWCSRRILQQQPGQSPQQQQNIPPPPRPKMQDTSEQQQPDTFTSILAGYTEAIKGQTQAIKDQSAVMQKIVNALELMTVSLNQRKPVT